MLLPLFIWFPWLYVHKSHLYDVFECLHVINPSLCLSCPMTLTKRAINDSKLTMKVSYLWMKSICEHHSFSILVTGYGPFQHMNMIQPKLFHFIYVSVLMLFKLLQCFLLGLFLLICLSLPLSQDFFLLSNKGLIQCTQIV